ncbi:hypothetical protein ACJRO7_001844 [Eucalyptus globulus]|uniref:Aminotransferase class I/classII large domain-containing protein n=1 Tax=Eucalyptus globulus TaxID=34317 RepID=A0ABD3LSA4_EUCGL
MENGAPAWKFRGDEGLFAASDITVRSILYQLMANLDAGDGRAMVPLGHGPAAEDAVVDALRSAKFNCYGPTVGILPARRAIADYLSRDLPYKLSPDDVHLTVGCTQAIEAILTVLARPGANILLPRPGYPYYDARAKHSHLETRSFDLLPDKGWEVDLKGVEDLADESTVAVVINNPGNPYGNVYSYQHLKKVAETARKLGIMVIADEVYGHLAFGDTPFVPMGVFGSIAPVLTLGSISKRWIAPGWRLGWLVTNDPNGFLKDTGAADICSGKIQEIPCITCPKKPGGGMSVMVKLNLSSLEGIKDDMEFCIKLAKEESVIVLPGIGFGMKNWLRVTFAVEPFSLQDGLGRIKAFYERHAKR